MEHRTSEIINYINKYFEQNPTQRFGQILFNLDISQFKNPEDPEGDNYQVRDIYSDTDGDIIKRIETRLTIINTKKPGDQ